METGLTTPMIEETLRWETIKIYQLEENNRRWDKNDQEHLRKDHPLPTVIWDNMFLQIETWEIAELLLLKEGYLLMKDLIVHEESSLLL